jgi:DNA-binding CsgD family transcriptional regulator
MKQLAIYGACGGLLIVAMRFVEYRFLVVSHSVEIYAALIAAAFAAVGIWFGLTITGRQVEVREVTVEVPVPAATGPFVADRVRIESLGITPRELEVLQPIAEGLSNKEMAERLFVSENTVKTHTSRVFDKLGASRRTQAVQFAKGQGLIAFVFVYFGIRSYRDNVLGGRSTFAKGFQAGILITLISCVCYVGAWLVTYTPRF